MENQNECCNQQGCCEGDNKKKFGWEKCKCGCHNSCSNIGISVGAALAVTLSWATNHSILWAVIHGLLNWFYVIYYMFINR
jgi:hypothetical protein